jgi:hypothetical protein
VFVLCCRGELFVTFLEVILTAGKEGEGMWRGREGRHENALLCSRPRQDKLSVGYKAKSQAKKGHRAAQSRKQTDVSDITHSVMERRRRSTSTRRRKSLSPFKKHPGRERRRIENPPREKAKKRNKQRNILTLLLLQIATTPNQPPT